MASTTSSTVKMVVDKLKMQAHPEVSVTAISGIVADLAMKVLAVKTPEIAETWKGSEGQIAVLVGVLCGFLTGRAGK